jgi:hypothetical protein
VSESGRFAVFLLTALSIWAALHAYVLWSVARTPVIAERVPRRALVAVAVALGLSYLVGRLLDGRGLESLAYPFELVGAVWIGVVFLVFTAVVLCDLLRLPLPLLAPDSGRTAAWLTSAAANLPAAGAAAALALGAIGAVQHLRGPVVVDHEIRLQGLPAERDGMVLVQVSDLHLGSLLGQRWLERRRAQVEALRPDVVAVVGDLVDGNAAHVERLLPRLARLRAPFGVWAVTGNHEFYAGLDRSVKLMEEAGFRVLRNGWAEVAPGLVFAGVDDLTVRRQLAPQGRPAQPLLEGALDTALAGRPAGATVLLSHTPWLAQRAANLGVGLMLSGHTHDGQIWPFGYLVAMQYPFLGGAYDVGAMRLVVCRGTGSWGPPLRLWRRSEIVRIVLRSK